MDSSIHAYFKQANRLHKLVTLIKPAQDVWLIYVFVPDLTVYGLELTCDHLFTVITSRLILFKVRVLVYFSCTANPKQVASPSKDERRGKHTLLTHEQTTETL